MIQSQNEGHRGIFKSEIHVSHKMMKQRDNKEQCSVKVKITPDYYFKCDPY